MSSTGTLKDANRLVSEQEIVLKPFSDPKSFLILHLLHKRGARDIGYIAHELNLYKSEVKHIIAGLEKGCLVCQKGDNFELTSLTKKRIEYGTISLEYLVGTKLTFDPTVPHALPGTYEIRECIGKGATSFTFCAEQSSIHCDRTLKIFLPDTVTYDQLDVALQKRRMILGQAIPEIIEVGQIDLQFPDGRSAIVPCIVLKYVNSGAKTFAEFLNAQDNINKAILERFITRVGGALAAIEEVGLTHGDLHERNILVVPGSLPSVAKDFWVIDFIGIPSTSSPQLEVPSDIDNFRGHLLQAALITCERAPGYSARLNLGESVFRVLEGLRKGYYKTFKDMLQDFDREDAPIPEDHFRKPASEPFEWLRVEWIHSPDWLYKLFEPVPSIFKTISRFGNTWISGPRGCGKSHYLRVLAFHPSALISADKDQELADKLRAINYDFKKVFGILFACRLGEFKGFAPEAMRLEKFDAETQKFLKHIIVLKIWNKTLATIGRGIESLVPSTNRPLIEVLNDIQELQHFLEERLGTMAMMGDNPTSIFQQCVAMCTAMENSAIARWNYSNHRPNVRLLDERDLDGFFAVLKRTFPDLSQTRFYIIVDDASDGHIHFEMQKVLNSLVRAAQENHCFKITCEKFMYTLDTSDGRAIDPRHEVTYVDLSETSIGTHRDSKAELSEYMAKVVNSRLKAAGYKSDIVSMLGKSQDVKEFLSALSLPGARHPKEKGRQTQKSFRPKAQYTGWDVIWNISHGSIRTLLELIEHIFKTNHVTHDTITIPPGGQDKAVRAYSQRQYRALSMLPGEFRGEPIGEKLQAIISSIGVMSKEYLKNYDTGDDNRWYETISIERTDRLKLNKIARETLQELVKYGLLLDDGLNFSRAQFGRCHRYDLNKIFAPDLQITYRVRNHMYISRKNFEELLVNPALFVTQKRKKLKRLVRPTETTRQKILFGGDDSGY